MQKSIVITGASRGLGLEFCRQYLAAGEKVFGCCRTPESSAGLLELKKQSGDQLELIPLDITQPTMVNNLRHVIDCPIDILINNAGVYGPKGLAFDEVQADPWLEVFRADTIAPLMVVQALVDQVSLSKEKKIILMSSKMGSIEDNQKGGSYLYRSAKAALNAVGKSLAVDLADKGISVGIVHPGWVQTDMGGAQALIDAQTSIKGLRRVIEQLSPAISGHFVNYDGTSIPW